MAKRIPIAEFVSDAFTPVLPEECQVNPGVYGAELAFWLCTALAQEGVPTSYPEFEDWCWYLTYVAKGGAEFEVLCLNVDGSDTRWSLELHRQGGGLLGSKRPSFSEARELLGALKSVLVAEAAVTDLVWKHEALDAA